MISALLNLRTNLAFNQDSHGDQENDEVEELLHTANDLAPEDPAEDAMILNNNDASIPSVNTAHIIMPDDELNAKIRSLNHKQRECF